MEGFLIVLSCFSLWIRSVKFKCTTEVSGKLHKKYILNECVIQNNLIFFSQIADFEKREEEYLSY